MHREEARSSDKQSEETEERHRHREREREREREKQHKRGGENEGRNERQVQSGFPPTKSTLVVDLVARFGNLNLHQ